MGRLLSCIFLSLFLQTSFISAKLPDWVTPEMVAMVADDKAKCMAVHGTTQDLIDSVNDGNIPNDPKITCYMYCLFESFSVIDEDGQLEAEMLAGLFPEDIQAKGLKVLPPCATQGKMEDIVP
ncbi:general odorant-binding protein 69a-like isoform X2 [Chelonus insularis]|uniref:general odorant-binding protein 69a-like isoform X2 n=1 Tax=Chelonus insularis TaxID=460826 RepID=UPI00158F255E|nr:general odorant-binding protein 69a-like isoform X2 [Chelonus insularis]